MRLRTVEIIYTSVNNNDRTVFLHTMLELNQCNINDKKATVKG
jgi:hypothetical protein